MTFGNINVFEGIKDKPDFSNNLRAVSHDVVNSAIEVSLYLESIGVKHVIVGALAVGSYTTPRATDDIDLLVDDSLFVDPDVAIVILKPGIPYIINNINIDYLSATTSELDKFKREEIDEAKRISRRDPPVISVNALVAMKLEAYRYKDRADIVGMIHQGLKISAVRTFLKEKRPDLLEHFDELVAEVRAE